MFDQKLSEREIPTYTRLAPTDDTTRSLEERARSYLDANCAHCHRPKGTVANFDARFDTPLHQQNLIGGPVVLDQGVDRARVITPNDIWRSILYMRANTNEAFHMPPLARNTIDEPGMALLRSWIESLPGKPAQPPPEISPKGGNFQKNVTVTLKGQPGATIHYTLDGSAPTESDPIYEKPITLSEPTIFRAVAARSGYKDSIAIQEVFVVGE
jgi:mono/diheme cytochrome c family protein